MGIFRRGGDRSGGQDQPEEPDAEFAFLTSGQGSRLRRLVREAFGEVGLEVTVHADHVLDAEGRQFGLANLAAGCHNADGGERSWPDLVRGHVSTIVRGMDADSPFDTRTSAELHESTYSRVVGEDSLVPGITDYHRVIAPGLFEVLNLDLPDTVAFYSGESVEDHGGADDLFRIGRVNLRRVLPAESAPLEHEGGRIQVLMGDSMFLASTLIHLDEVVERETRHALDRSTGVLFVVPFRHQLAFHVPSDASVIPSINLLVGFGAAGHADAPGPISPDVYWWHDGRVERVSHRTEDGVVVDAGPDLVTVLERCEGPPDR